MHYLLQADRRAPVALNLTPIDPIVAEWLISRRLTPRRVNLGAPGEGIGGLGLMMLGFLLSTVVPDIWWFVVGGIGLILDSWLMFWIGVALVPLALGVFGVLTKIGYGTSRH